MFVVSLCKNAAMDIKHLNSVLGESWHVKVLTLADKRKKSKRISEKGSKHIMGNCFSREISSSFVKE